MSGSADISPSSSAEKEKVRNFGELPPRGKGREGIPDDEARDQTTIERPQEADGAAADEKPLKQEETQNAPIGSASLTIVREQSKVGDKASSSVLAGPLHAPIRSLPKPLQQAAPAGDLGLEGAIDDALSWDEMDPINQTD
eukprot:Cvel_11617.t2-p1 / transcript=Cvel_11617.t2 / gene=Cvel_11617 / organism=Chromera_velia_CCMP2878 / gene_product=hypothetical protein / transcript_product=hypothetical protein / location=Cvel_scaffold735:59697-60116(-) / protein_length=140 / sequence_SO=supercontig / SO=protein_coding / is_pseudo=false